MLRTIERPTYATLRRCFTAASITCCTRRTCEAKQATMMRWFFALVKTRSSTGAMSRSLVVKPGTSELVESTMNRSTPSSPSRANARRSVSRLSSGNWSILKSPVCSTVPAGRLDRHRERVRDRVVDRDELADERPDLELLALDHGLLRHVAVPVLLQLALEQRERELRADHGDVAPLTQQVGQPADVVLVAVRQDHRDDVVEAVPDRLEVRQDQVHAGLVLVGDPQASARRGTEMVRLLESCNIVLNTGHNQRKARVCCSRDQFLEFADSRLLRAEESSAEADCGGGDAPFVLSPGDWGDFWGYPRG